MSEISGYWFSLQTGYGCGHGTIAGNGMGSGEDDLRGFGYGHESGQGFGNGSSYETGYGDGVPTVAQYEADDNLPALLMCMELIGGKS